MSVHHYNSVSSVTHPTIACRCSNLGYANLAEKLPLQILQS